MKKLFLPLFALLFSAQISVAQCVPAAPATVFDSLVCNAGSTKTISNVPTGRVIKLIVTTPPVVVNFDLCPTNPGAGPYPEGTNDSYVTILDDNSAGANVINDFDDGCTNISGSGFGPSVGFVRFDNAGAYYLYLTEYDAQGNDYCIADGANSNYIIELDVTAGVVATNDECTQPLALILNTPVSATTYGTTLNTTIEGVGDASLGIAAFCGLPNGYPLTAASWFSFNAPAAGAYVLYANNITSPSSQWFLDVTFFPAADVSCVDINQTSFANAQCKSIYFNRDSAIFVLPAAGNYLIPVGTFDSGNDWELTIRNAAVTPSCQDASIGTVTTSSACYDAASADIDFNFSGATSVSQVGNYFGYYVVLASGPISDFSNYTTDPNYLGAGATDASSFTIPVADFLSTYPAGTYYFYFVAANDVDIYSNNNEEVINFNCADTSLVVFEVKGPGESCFVGIDKAMVNNAISIYPNPASNQLFVTTKLDNELTYNVKSISGQTVISGMISKNDNHINIELLSNGIYFVELTGQSGTAIKKLSVNK
jgi:hypothetical protein